MLLTHGYFLAEDPREQRIMKPYPPLGILSIAAWLRQRGMDVELFDTTFATWPQFQQHLLDNPPQVVGIYTNLMTKLNVLRAVGFIKGTPALRHTKVVLGGPEIRHHAERFLQHGADVVAIGEGEQTMEELLRCIKEGGELEQVAGIAFLRGGQLIRTPERALLRSIDELPIPFREGIPLERYLQTWKQHHGASSISISTMRGCPYTCRWCSRAVYGGTYRRRSPAAVADEMEQLRDRYNPDSLWFVDDVFTINHRWLEGFAAELAARKLRIPYECITRADRLNERAVELLKTTGCFRVWIGAESGSQRVVDAMDRRVKVEQVRQMVQLSKRHGIQTGTFIMVGYPGETEADILETIHHLKVSNPDHYTITVAYPITGTPLFNEVQSQLISPPEWAASTDRDLEFERPYSRRYYRFAISRITHEVQAHKLANGSGNGSVLARLNHQARAVAAAMAMRFERRFGTATSAQNSLPNSPTKT